MTLASGTACLCTAVVLSLLVFYVSVKRVVESQHHPPGPRPLPFIGNLLDLPRKREWETFTRWRDTYGMSTLPLFRSHFR